MNGLNEYDFSARWQDHAVPGFTTPDPLAEQYPDESPYLYCGNNPVNRVDLTGLSYFKNGNAVIWDSSTDQTLDYNGEEYSNIGDDYSNEDEDGTWSYKEGKPETFIENYNSNYPDFSFMGGGGNGAGGGTSTTDNGGNSNQNSNSGQNGGTGFLNNVSSIIQQYTSPTAAFTVGATENKIGNILTNRAVYGKLLPETIIRTSFANINVSTELLQATGTALKGVGVGLGVVGLASTAAQYYSGQISGAEASLDLVMGGVGFIPGYGWAVSGAYFLIAKPLYNYATEE